MAQVPESFLTASRTSSATAMAMLRPHCIVLDPMQRSGDFSIEVEDRRLAFYRQAENALYVRMAVIFHALG